MRVKSKTIFLAYLLLLSILVAPAIACPPPDCPDCYYFDGDDCVSYGNCWGGCPDCHSCVNCWCEDDCSGGQTCCGGSCCDSAICKTCVNGVCEWDCSLDNCEQCANGSCESYCDSNICEICDGTGWCLVCGGDPDQICCDGTCTPKCEDSTYSPCDTSNNENYQCPGCAGSISGPTCFDFKMREYTGNLGHRCTGGCPGDCGPYPDVHCYTEYKCREDLIRPGVCGEKEGAPMGLACLEAGTYFWCIPCKKDTADPGEKFYVINQQACQ